MSSPFFKFKQFTVWHDRCAMKVGTDGVLLGAWTPYTIHHTPYTNTPARVLDIGTGSGLIALMLSQRFPTAIIDAIDIDEAAVAQARDNFAASPWSDRLHAHHISLQDYTNDQRLTTNDKYNLVVSNPPFFTDSLKNPDAARRLARHTDTLSLDELFACAADLLTDDGLFSLILPADSKSQILNLKSQMLNGFHLSHLTRVYPKPGKPVKRLLMTFTKKESPLIEDSLFIESESSHRSPEYSTLTAEFYL